MMLTVSPGGLAASSVLLSLNLDFFLSYHCAKLDITASTQFSCSFPDSRSLLKKIIESCWPPYKLMLTYNALPTDPKLIIYLISLP